MYYHLEKLDIFRITNNFLIKEINTWFLLQLYPFELAFFISVEKAKLESFWEKRPAKTMCSASWTAAVFLYPSGSTWKRTCWPFLSFYSVAVSDGNGQTFCRQSGYNARGSGFESCSGQIFFFLLFFKYFVIFCVKFSIVCSHH